MDEKIFHLVGWLLFILCSFIYMYDSFVEMNILLFLGGIVFFLGCIAFVIPLCKELKSTVPKKKRSIDK
jgi:hypothetical protein